MADKQCVDEQAVLEIISSKSVTTFFQPIISIATKSIIGFEAFSRGGKPGCVLDPSVIFHKDLPAEIKVQMDRLCREKALEYFKPIHDKHKGMLLFVNLNPDILPHVEEGSEVLHTQVQKAGVAPANVVIEASMHTGHPKEGLCFVNKYRELGYRFGMDDCSVEAPFSHAIALFRPDFVKIDRTFFGNGDRHENAGKALEAVFAVASRSGATVIGQQVESEEESIRLMAAGLHLQQGYYYSKDTDEGADGQARSFLQKIVDTGEHFKRVRREVIRLKKERMSGAFRSVDSVCSKLSNVSEEYFEDTLSTLSGKTDGVISFFVLDSKGVQITSRHHVKSDRDTVSSEAILGTKKGVDHSMYDYMIFLDMGHQKYVSPPFVSPYTREEACLITKPFFNLEGARYIAAVELPYPG